MRRKTARYDRRVEVLQRVNIRNPKTGTDKAVWTPLTMVFARIEDVLPGRADRFAEVVDLAKRPARVWMRYRADIDGEMRLKFGGAEYAIVSGPAEVGRREEIELLVEHYTSEGQRP